jgi:hypothetical protein
MRRTDRRPRLRVHKHTLRTLTADQAAGVRGGERVTFTGKHTHPHSPLDTRYCLDGDLE